MDMDRARGQNNTIIIFMMRGGRERFNTERDNRRNSYGQKRKGVNSRSLLKINLYSLQDQAHGSIAKCILRCSMKHIHSKTTTIAITTAMDENNQPRHHIVQTIVGPVCTSCETRVSNNNTLFSCSADTIKRHWKKNQCSNGNASPWQTERELLERLRE